jgi:hypothetical protein
MRTFGYFLVTRHLMQDQLHGPYSPYGFQPGTEDADPADQTPIPTAVVVAMLAICIAVVVAIAILSPGPTDPSTSASSQAATSSFTR